MPESADKPVVGFIGVGFMGHGMAKNILRGGYALVVKGNRNRVPVDDLVAQGAREAASVADMVAACDIIHICLPNSDRVEELVRGPGGILDAAKPGLIVIDTTTADPASTVALAAQMHDAGMTLIDAPLGRTPAEAEAGTLDAMVGCDDATFASVLPVIDCWAANIQHVGPVGSGHKMKLIMNFIAMSYGALYSEAVTLAARVGLPPQQVREVIGSSRLSNGFFETFMRYTVDRDRDAHKFTIENASKDIRYVANMASGAGVVNLVGAAVKHAFTNAEAQGGGGDYLPMISDYIAALSGVDMAEEVKKGGG